MVSDPDVRVDRGRSRGDVPVAAGVDRVGEFVAVHLHGEEDFASADESAGYECY
jgi:hypothetical protein